MVGVLMGSCVALKEEKENIITGPFSSKEMVLGNQKFLRGSRVAVTVALTCPFVRGRSSGVIRYCGEQCSWFTDRQ